MNDVLALLRDYVQRDYEAAVAHYIERDYEAFARKVSAVEDCFSRKDDLYAGFSRPRELDDEWFEKSKKMSEQIVPRKIFKIERHEHPESGTIHRAWLSGHFDYSQGVYNQLTDVVATETGPRIVALHFRCLSCRGRSGLVEECPECDGWGWEWGSGRRIGALGQPVEVLELAPVG